MVPRRVTGETSWYGAHLSALATQTATGLQGDLCLLPCLCLFGYPFELQRVCPTPFLLRVALPAAFLALLILLISIFHHFLFPPGPSESFDSSLGSGELKTSECWFYICSSTSQTTFQSILKYAIYIYMYSFSTFGKTLGTESILAVYNQRRQFLLFSWNDCCWEILCLWTHWFEKSLSRLLKLLSKKLLSVYLNIWEESDYIEWSMGCDLLKIFMSYEFWG